jgi:hypothetical protein
MNQVTRWTPSWSQLFIAPYDQKIQELLDMTHTLKQLSDGLPRDPKTFIQPGLIQAMLSPQAHPIKTELEKNSLLNWSPKSPTRLYHGELDVDVPFENSMIAQQAFSSRGSQQVQLISLGAVDHAGGAWPAFRLALQWFELMALHAATPLSDNGTSTTD